MRLNGETLPEKRHKSFNEWWNETPKPEYGCWLWVGPKSPAGYGMACGARGTRGAYTYAYELAHGPLAQGMTVDHVCHNQDDQCPGGSTCLHRLCVRPDHLKAATADENVKSSPNFWPGRLARQEHCQSGEHILPPARPGKRRECQPCRRARRRERYRLSGKS